MVDHIFETKIDMKYKTAKKIKRMSKKGHSFSISNLKKLKDFPSPSKGMVNFIL